MRDDTPTQQLRDVHWDDEDDTRINAIKVLTDRSSLSCCILDSGVNRHIFNNETCLEGTPYSHVYSRQRNFRLHNYHSSMCYRRHLPYLLIGYLHMPIGEGQCSVLGVAIPIPNYSFNDYIQ